MKGKLVAGGLILLSFFISGCWSRVELDQRAIVAGIGVDKADQKKIEVTIQHVIQPRTNQTAQKAGGRGGGGDGGGQRAVELHSDLGYALADTLFGMGMKLGKRLFIGEAEVFVVGEDLARQGVEKAIDFYDRFHQASTRNLFLVAKGDAKEVLKTPVVGGEQIWAYGIANMVRTSVEQTGKAPLVEIRRFLQALESRTMAPVATAVEVVRKKEKVNNQEGQSGSGGNAPKELRLSGTAVFDDFNLIGWLDERQTRGFMWVVGDIERVNVTLPAPGGGGGLVTLGTIRAASEIRPEMDGDTPSFTVSVREESRLFEVQVYDVNIRDPAVIKGLEKRKIKLIEKEIRSAITEAQRLNADIFGFGEAFRRKYPTEWKKMEKKWGKVFPRLKVKLKVEAKIRRTGKITNPAVPGW